MPAQDHTPSQDIDGSTHDDDDEDGCICGLEHVDDEVTLDEELPATCGGIDLAEEETPENEDDVDGCEIDFTEANQTQDQDLPAAVGGV
jgi:hypothetical protein